MSYNNILPDALGAEKKGGREGGREAALCSCSETAFFVARAGSYRRTGSGPGNSHLLSLPEMRRPAGKLRLCVTTRKKQQQQWELMDWGSSAVWGLLRRLQWLFSYITTRVSSGWQTQAPIMPNNKILDEFAVPEEAQDMLMEHRPQIERLFRVELNVVGVLGSDPKGARKIWLQLQGSQENLHSAKEYIKGLCTPELQDEVQYPKDMQCIFLGAHGLFLDCLIRGTSANLTFLHPGTLLISGLAEAFVMAQSRIQEFVGKHQKNPKLPEEQEAQVKRSFRELVENYDDKHAMDLLILPTSVKEELLNLVKEIREEDTEEGQRNGYRIPSGFGRDCSLGFLSSLSDSEGTQSTESTNMDTLQQGPVSTVTGAQRFEEALQTKFKLTLANTPGKKNLRMVIIDGSNVAMMHGLNQFFSCRGIALAVQYFWKRGHREVNVLVPAYRMEEDSNVRERHFLTELHNLSILSLTPSRKIDGKGIVPYDDRMMLKLAEQTNGVIVTNDQFRDLAKESKRWIKLIKESLLQYTFVGDIFMVPDDPLGRSGPTLAEFLKKKNKTKYPDCHSFSGQPAPQFTPSHPISQTEVLHLRDRRPPAGSVGDYRRGRHNSPAEKETLRSTEETEWLRSKLLEIFEGQDRKVDFVLIREPCCQDLNKLSEAILSFTF
ncbi:protein KHNYN-like [Crotalus adamanteus]|uniref:Protein KHNYN-like n=1 Tax=Crotalus adamanteus TaxID=8729 RepID=A0AAW1B6V6_CROAD